MFLKKWLRPLVEDGDPSSLSQTVEDAILLGGVDELDEALSLAERDVDFPEDLFYGLEALRYFRAHYGPGRQLEPKDPLQKQKAAVMEISWGAELLDRLRKHDSSTIFPIRG